MKSEMFCCQGLANLIANAGRRGLSVLVVKTPTGLQFCPFCAAPIREAITKNLQAFAELADVHQMLQSIHPKKT
jgi:hypothetical protein